ncbi:MAG: DUF853 family protein [Firmicutes bacterium]|nr:DUF853 family protein [Bacillota bacterium]
MYKDGKFVIGMAGDKEIVIEPKMANRHGLITGATGTGKTTTLKTLAESFSEAGVPVFFSDVKGDLKGMARNYPVTFWDIYGNGGIPARTTVSEMGPILLAKLMDLNDTQSDVLSVVFKIADDQGLLLIDTKDLKSMIQYVADNNYEFASTYGNVSQATATTIIRNIVAMETKGAENFFAEPALNIVDWFVTGADGKGMINILDAGQLIHDSTLYSTFLLWMLSELFETLPEIGDPEIPRMAFFFDEAHLLFKDINKALMDKIEQVIKLIRSKGVGVYFITQSPKDIPDQILAQLGNKIQHGLRAYTPSDERVVRTVADTFRTNPEFDTYETILALGTGEALVSTLGLDGVPTVVEKTKILAPLSLGVDISPEEKQQMVLMSNAYLRYQNMYDRDSAFEFLQRLNEKKVLEEEQLAYEREQEKISATEAKAAEIAAKKAEREAEKEAERIRKEQEKEQLRLQKEAEKREAERKKAIKQVASTTVGSIGRQIGRSLGSKGGTAAKNVAGNFGAQLARSILGTFLK